MERSYVIYGAVPWDGPWAVDQNIAHALARRYPVLYVDPPLSPASPFRYVPRSVSWSRLAAVFDRRVRTRDGLQVFGPLALPPLHDRRMHSTSLPLVREQVRRAVKRAGLSKPIVVAYRALHDLAGACDEALRAAVIMDNLPAGAELLGRNRGDIEREVAATCDAADLLCVPSQPVQSLLAQQGWRSELLPFGFASDLAPLYDSATEPPEYRALPRPLIGYTGGIDDRLDFELILRLADRFPEGSLVFVGAMSPRLSASARAVLRSRANIHVLGVRPRGMPPRLRPIPRLRAAPVHQLGVDQISVTLEALGIPVCGCPDRWDRARPNFGVIGLRSWSTPKPASRPSRGWPKPLRAGDEGRAVRREFALANTWDARVDELDSLVDTALQQRRPVSLAA